MVFLFRRKKINANLWRVRAKDTTQRAIGPTLFLGQLVGLLPVNNITDYSTGAHSLNYKWWSLRSLLAATLIFFTTMEVAMFCYRIYKTEFSVGAATAVFFFSSTGSTALLMYHLACSGRWKRVMQQFEKMEWVFTNEVAYPLGTAWTLRRKIGTLTAVAIPVALFEHAMFLMAKMTNAWFQIQKCHLEVPFYEHFLRTERRHLFSVFPFSYVIALPFELTNTCNTIAWTFLDLFIMMYSIALAHRFQQISRRIRRILLQPMPDDFWVELREHYVMLQELVGSVDDRLGSLILLSCGTDVYFTCFLLFNSFGDFPERLNAVYFKFSISFVVSRTLMTLYFATTVHEAGRGPYLLLRSIPRDGWGPEVDRFAYQLSCETVALSGKQFFYFTRNVILTLVATIVTYELVIVDHILEAPEVVQKSCEVNYG